MVSVNHKWIKGKAWMSFCVVLWLLVGALMATGAKAATFSTTTVQGTVYLANGQPGSGTLVISWPAFTTAAGQLVTADNLTVTIGSDGFVSVSLAPNVGATPAGQYYTAVYYMSDGTTSTQYWVVPAAAQATLAAVQSQVMPSSLAVQTVSKSYVDQEIAELTESLLTASGGTLSGNLYLNGDPTTDLQAADKHYVDEVFSDALPTTGGTVTGTLTAKELGALWQVDQFTGSDFGAKLAACVNGLSSTYGGTCDARNFSGTQGMASSVTISTPNVTVWLPCATIATAQQIVVTAGTRNVSFKGCALRGASTASGSQGGTVFLYSGSGAMFAVGDASYAVNTMGFHLDNVVVNTTAATSASAQALVAYRTQEMELSSLYLLGNANQTAVTLDGTGNYTGGTFFDVQTNGFLIGINGIGHQTSNSATTDWLNASTFVRLHVNCPTSGGSPISGTIGINLQQGDGNTFTGGDVEGCSTALHLGSNAQNNTVVGLRNENSTSQVVADAGSAYNSWITGGTMYTGALTDNGTRNSFLDTFHRSFNGVNGDWYGSQKDATITNHYRLGTGAGSERGLLNRYQTDYGYRWTEGLSDGTSGAQFYQILDELNNVYRLSIAQYNSGSASTNNQTVINAAGTGAVVLNGSTNAGTGGLIVGSGGSSVTSVATIDKSGNTQLNGTLQVGGATTFVGSPTVRNSADSEIDMTLWAGATAAQKEAFIYKDYSGASQWYMLKDASNNWVLNSAVGGVDSIKAYQSTNSGDTYIDASNTSGAVRVNYESGSGTAFNVYGGNTSTLYASFAGTALIKFPGLAATSGKYCLQIDNSGYISNTGATCSTGVGTVSSGTSGQIAYYTGSGSVIAGESSVPVTSGGTGAITAAGGLANLGGVSSTLTTTQTMAGGLNLPAMEGVLYADQYQSPASSGNNGVANALTACGSQTAPCVVSISPSYAKTESQLWNMGMPGWYSMPVTGPKSTQPTAGIFDMRYGVPQWSFNNGQLVDNRHYASPSFFMSTIASNSGRNAQNPSALILGSVAYAGGKNNNEDKMNLTTMKMVSAKYTQAQGGGDLQQLVVCAGNGDCVGHSLDTITYGGPNAGSDEGNESARWEAIEGGQVFSATLASVSTGSDGSKSFTTSSQVYNGYQGEGRMLIDLTNAYNGVTHSNYIAAVTNGVVSCGGTCDWDSTFGVAATTTLSTAVSNGSSSTTVFPQSSYAITVASSTGFTAGNVACIFDADMECETITSVGTGTITLATMRMAHAAGAVVSSGGLTGYAFEAEADRLTPSNLNGVANMPDSGIASTIRYALPVMYNSSGNVLTLFSGYNCNACAGYSGRAYPQMGSGGAVTLTITSGVVTSCTASGGSGYYVYGSGAPPQISITGSWTTAPSVHVGTAGLSGAIGSCVVDAGGTGVTTAAATVVPTNPYDLYPAAKVMNVYNASTGKVDGSFTTEPAVGSFVAGDSVEEPHYYIQHNSGLFSVAGSFLPTQSYEASNAINVVMKGLWHGADNGMLLSNDSDVTLYASYPAGVPQTLGRGQTIAPYGLNLKGAFSDGLKMSIPPFGYGAGPSAAVRVGCGSIACSAWTSSYGVLGVDGNGATDALDYLPSARQWDWYGSVLSLHQSSLVLNQTGYLYANGGSAATFSTTIPVTALSGTTLPSTVVSSSLTGVGTITSGVWNGTAIAPGYISTGTSGANIPLLSGANTWSASTTTFANGAASADYVVIKPGSTADQIGALEFANYSGTSQWEIRKDASNTFRIRDAVNSLDRFTQYAAGQTVINSGGSSSVAINNTSGSGTGGFTVYEGGTNYNTLAFSVTSSGNASVTGTLTAAGMVDSAVTSAALLGTNSSGTIVAETMSGDATLATSGALTLATVNSTTGSFGSSTAIPAVTVNAKGLVTAVTTNAVAATTINGTTCTPGSSCTVSFPSSAVAFTTLTDGSTVTLATGGAGVSNATLALNHATTTRALNVSGLASGASFTVVLKQDATGGAALTLGTGCTWYLGTNSGYVASTAPTLTTSASAINIMTGLYDGTNCYVNVR